jgi:D-alanyl-D-alanine carboxypeptidase
MPNLSATFSRKLGAVGAMSLAMAATSLIISPAEARHWRTHHRHNYAHSYAGKWRPLHASIRSRYGRATRSESNIAATVVDGNTGKTIYARNENEQRFPASIAKVMTLYLLFEQLDEGHLRLDSNIRISAGAAAQKPTVLGLQPGESISVDDAIKAVVTRSANDIAVAIAESIGGDESRFAALMTQKAHELGMSRTHFANASGLPDAEQLTTAHDLAILGRAIQERFPRYYRYFATRVFYYRHAAILNHNHLLDHVEGMDGIKTGYTNASGFNLLTSVKRDGHYIVAVVLGGATARSRDRIMAGLIEAHIADSAISRAASSNTSAKRNTQAATAPQSYASSPGTSESQLGSGLRSAFTPVAARPASASDPLAVASPNADSVPPNRPRPAFVAGAPKPAASDNPAVQGEPSRKQARLDGSTVRSPAEDSAGLSSATPAALGHGSGGGQPLPPKLTTRIGDLPQTAIPGAADLPRPAEAHNGWMIQIGATPDIDKATELLARAKSEGPRILARAHAFTEKIQKGSETLYRARFAGLEGGTAERLCKTLKRSGFSCFATRN